MVRLQADQDGGLLTNLQNCFGYNVTIKENIRASMRDARLVPHDPEAMVSKLDVVPHTLTPPYLNDTLWEFYKPSNLFEVEAQSTHVRRYARLNRDSPLSPLLGELFSSSSRVF